MLWRNLNYFYSWKVPTESIVFLVLLVQKISLFFMNDSAWVHEWVNDEQIHAIQLVFSSPQSFVLFWCWLRFLKKKTLSIHYFFESNQLYEKWIGKYYLRYFHRILLLASFCLSNSSSLLWGIGNLVIDSGVCWKLKYKLRGKLRIKPDIFKVF